MSRHIGLNTVSFWFNDEVLQHRFFCLDVQKKALSDEKMNREKEGEKVSLLCDVQAFAMTESLAIKSGKKQKHK